MGVVEAVEVNSEVVGIGVMGGSNDTKCVGLCKLCDYSMAFGDLKYMWTEGWSLGCGYSAHVHVCVCVYEARYTEKGNL